VIEPINNISGLEKPTSSPTLLKGGLKKAVSSSGTEVPPAKISEETRAKIESMVRELAASKQMNMYYDRDLDRVVVTVVNEENREVIRQIPSSEFVSFVKKFDEFIGLMVNRRV
jgi:flagellar protein FlaG